MNLAESDPDLFQVLEDVRREQGGPATQAVDAVETLWRVGTRLERGKPRLSKAERHLVLVHDSRCAEVLRQCAFAALMSGTEPRDYFHLSSRQRAHLDQWIQPPQVSLLDRVLQRRGMHALPLTRHPRSPLEATRSCVLLSRASSAIQPSWIAEIYCSRALTALGDLSSAEKRLRHVRDSCPQDSSAGYFADVGEAVLQVTRDQPQHAVHTYRSAARRQRWASDAMNWFVFSACLGMKEEAMEAVVYVDDYPVDAAVPIPRVGDRRPTTSARPVIAQIESRLGYHSSRIAHALLASEQ